nr:MAG TPA: neurotoxin [Caudoviricetes sp.]
MLYFLFVFIISDLPCCRGLWCYCYFLLFYIAKIVICFENTK